MRSPVAILCASAVLAGCGAAAPDTRPPSVPAIPAALAVRERPIGTGPRFIPPTPNRAVRDCRARLRPRFAAHVELFGADRVVLLPAGIGTRGPRTLVAGRVATARCYGPVVTLDPTGVVLVRRGTQPAATLGRLFSTWGVPLSRHGAASFRGPVAVFVGGRRVHGDPRAVALTRHAVVVVEVGPFVPPHRRFAFGPGV